jgi:hypothetical protein
VTRIITTVATGFAGLCHGPNGEAYVTDFTAHNLRRLDPSGPVVLVGNGAKGVAGRRRPCDAGEHRYADLLHARPCWEALRRRGRRHGDDPRGRHGREDLDAVATARLEGVVEELALAALGRCAVRVDGNVLVAFVPQLQRRPGLHEHDASARELDPLGRLAEVHGQPPVEHDEGFLLDEIAVALAFVPWR